MLTVPLTIERVENALIKSGAFSLPGRRSLGGVNMQWKAVVVDVAEHPIERPKKKQRKHCSGKKKRHTLKSQVAVDHTCGIIIAAACGKGRTHDFRLFKASGFRLHKDTEFLGDGGYQGIAKLHAKSCAPHKRRKKQPLTKTQQAHNKALAADRVLAENVIRRLKVFRVLKETYYHRRRRFSLHLLAGLYNWNLLMHP